jgi:hypothetical protein
MLKRILPLLVFITSSIFTFSQAGYGVYQFLDLPVSSRLAALGGANISLRDNDLNFAFGNPALLTSETNNVIGLSMANYLSDIKFGTAVYGKTIGNKNYFAVGIQYIDYGSFRYADELNTDNGVATYFTAKDMALNIMYAHPLTEKISIGATLKPIYSVYERYTSYGLAMDAGVSYNDVPNLFSAGLVFRNMGTQFKGYYSDENGQHFEPLPLNIQLGMSKKLTHAPLRFSMTLNNLQHWNLNHESTNQATSTLSSSGTTDKSTTTNIKFIDMAFRHSIFAVEFVPSKNFYLSVGYNHRRHQELSISGVKSMAGFSFGGGIKLYKFHVGFGTTQFLAGNSSYQFSITTALSEFRL